MNIKELRKFMLEPGWIPVYLFNRELAKRTMAQRIKNESKHYVDDAGSLRTHGAVLPSAHWSDFQAHKFYETWDKRISQNFNQYRSDGHNNWNVSPSNGDGSFNGWRVE